jgi:hypothetical protein
MKNLTKLLKPLKTRNNFIQTARTKNDWDSIKAFPVNTLDEHEEPKDEDIVREIFDKNYYHFYNHAKNADSHAEIDQYNKARMWEHLYVEAK